jgi:hypothetical protein
MHATIRWGIRRSPRVWVKSIRERLVQDLPREGLPPVSRARGPLSLINLNCPIMSLQTGKEMFIEKISPGTGSKIPVANGRMSIGNRRPQAPIRVLHSLRRQGPLHVPHNPPTRVPVHAQRPRPSTPSGYNRPPSVNTSDYNRNRSYNRTNTYNRSALPAARPAPRPASRPAPVRRGR